MDTEIPVSNQALQDLIQQEATKIADSRLAPLRKEIAALKSSIHPKTKGGANQRAPQDKKINHKLENKPTATGK
jgi:hypothetical protein